MRAACACCGNVNEGFKDLQLDEQLFALAVRMGASADQARREEPSLDGKGVGRCTSALLPPEIS